MTTFSGPSRQKEKRRTKRGDEKEAQVKVHKRQLFYGFLINLRLIPNLFFLRNTTLVFDNNSSTRYLRF